MRKAHDLLPAGGAPHPHAFLSAWRERAGMTQAEVAGHFHVSDVTIHRWESGKAPVTVENFIILARLFGAETPGLLMFHPDQQHVAEKLRETADILNRLEAPDREAWLALGRRLATHSGDDTSQNAAE